MARVTTPASRRQPGNLGNANFSAISKSAGAFNFLQAGLALVEEQDPIDFGSLLASGPKATYIRSNYAKSSGQAKITIQGSKAFGLSVVKVKEYVSEASGKSYEKVVEYTGGSFPVKPGEHYEYAVQFDPSYDKGKQTGTLTITEPNRTLKSAISGSSFDKQFSLVLQGVQQSRNEIMPGESIDVHALIDVKQNAGSNLELRMTSPVKGVLLASADKWIGKSGVSSQSCQILTNAECEDNSALTVTIGIFANGASTPLATFPVTFAVQRKWLEWSYKRNAGKQTVWGKFQLASTGEFIWTAECYNSSSYFSDVFTTIACFPGLGPAGKSPGVMFGCGLPAGEIDRLFIQYTGRLGLSDFNGMAGMKLRSFLSVNEGGPLAAIGNMGDGIVDMLKSWTADNAYDKLPSNATGDTLKWLLSNKVQLAKVTSMKAWK